MRAGALQFLNDVQVSADYNHDPKKKSKYGPTKLKNKLEPRAFCDSDRCVCKARGIPFQDIKNQFKPIEKKVSKFTMFCPDCGSALFWRKA